MPLDKGNLETGWYYKKTKVVKKVVGKKSKPTVVTKEIVVFDNVNKKDLVINKGDYVPL